MIGTKLQEELRSQDNRVNVDGQTETCTPKVAHAKAGTKKSVSRALYKVLVQRVFYPLL